MVTDERDRGGPSRRDFLKTSGVGALTMAVAGCNEQSEDGSDGGSSNGTDRNGTGTGTPGGGDSPDGTGDQPFVATPVAVETEFAQAESDDLARGTFLDERYTRIEGEIPGFDVPEEVTPVGHAATYGHNMQVPGDDAGATTLHALSAGVLSLPNPDVEGVPANPYAERSLSDLVSAPEENLLLAAAGLGSTVEWLSDPVSVERTEEVTAEVFDGAVTVETFVGPVSAEPGRGLPDGEDDGFLDDGTAPRPQMTTVHTARGFVGGNVVIVGMVGGWGRPPTMGPPPTEIGPETADILADVYDDIVRAELFRRALSEGVMLWAEMACNLDEMGPEPEDVERTVEYGDYYGLEPGAQIELGYPDEERSSPDAYETELVRRTAPGYFDCESYDPEEHNPGEWVNLTIEQRVTAYTVGEDDAIPFGVIASPRAELEGEEQNPLVDGSLRPGSYLFQGVFDLVTEILPFEFVYWAPGSGASELETLSDVHMLGRDAEAKGFRGEIQYAPEVGDQTERAEAYLYLARITTAEEAVVACALSIDTGTDGFFDTQSATRRLFESAVGDVVAGPGTPNEWEDCSVDELYLVQNCRNTRLETSSGDALHQSNPQLVQGRNTAAPFDASTFSGTSLSSSQLRYGVFSYDVANRPEAAFETVLPRSDLNDLDADAVDPDVLFDRNAGGNDSEDDLPVFELQGSDSAVDLSFHAPSGYVHDVATVEEGPDYDVTGFEVLRLGVTYVVDPGGGANYGDGNGYPSQYDDTVDAVFEYLKRTYPTGLAVFRAESGIGGATKGFTDNASKIETIDYRQARAALERMADPSNGNWPYNGDTLTHKVSESEANRNIRNNGFDIWLLIVPENYYSFHRNDSGPWGLAPLSDRLAVTTTDGSTSRFPHGPTTSAEVAAQEIGHRIVSDPYNSPQRANGMDYPLAQRTAEGPELIHARYLDSSLTDGGDAPGIVSRAYSLSEGQFRVPTRHRWDDGFTVDSVSDAPTPFASYGPDGTDRRVGRIESYMSYTITDADSNGDTRSPWADGLITQDVINSDLNRAAGNLRTVKIGGITELGTYGLEGESEDDTGEPTVEAVEVFEDYVTDAHEERLAEAETTVDVSVFGPDGTVVAEKTVAGALGVEHVDVEEHRLDHTTFDVELPPDAVDVELVGARSDLRFNPITRPIRDAYERLPERARGATFDREELRTLLEDVDTAMDEGKFSEARDALATFAEQDLAGTIDPEFEPAANQYDEPRMRALFDEMIGRLDGLAGDGGGEIEVGEAPPWTDWVPEPSALPVFADSRGFYQCDLAAVLNSGSISQKASLAEPMANPFFAGYFGTLLWQELGTRGVGEAVVGPATFQTDADPAEVPAETAVFVGNAQVYLGSFDTDRLDTAVAEAPFSESDTAGVYVYDGAPFALAYGETYVVGAETVDEVVTILETGAGERDRWDEVNDEVEWLYEAGADGDFTLINHLDDGTISTAETDLVDLTPFTEANGLAQSASLDGATFTDATTSLIYPAADAVELELLRETLGADASDREFVQDGRFVQVSATFGE